MSSPPVEIYATGETTVVGFGGRDVPGDVNLVVCRDWLLEIIRQQRCRVLAFDLTGVRLMPSGLLGLLASMRNEGVEVHLYNPSVDVREVLEITHLDQLMPIHEVDVKRSPKS
ncbi:MAG: STAS domain-containing protein [Planctomycetaceae bacterium]|nr:STAS domain-containing protein [Planctomycetaceae bacterium]